MIKQLIREIEISKILNEELTGDVLKIVNFFDDLFDKIVFKTLEDHPESIFMTIGDEIYMEQDYENDKLWCRYDGYWSFFKMEFDYNYQEIRDLIQYMVIEQLKNKVGTPGKGNALVLLQVREQLKNEVGTPWWGYSQPNVRVREQLKNEVGTPNFSKVLNPFSVREQLKNKVGTPEGIYSDHLFFGGRTTKK